MRKVLNNKGVSIIELMAVLLILSLIMAFILPSVGNTIDKARAKAMLQDINRAFVATEIYLADHPDVSPTAIISLSELVDGGYMKDKGTLLDVRLTGDGNLFAVMAVSGSLCVTIDYWSDKKYTNNYVSKNYNTLTKAISNFNLVTIDTYEDTYDTRGITVTKRRVNF